jgi:hypothetical protein
VELLSITITSVISVRRKEARIKLTRSVQRYLREAAATKNVMSKAKSVASNILQPSLAAYVKIMMIVSVRMELGIVKKQLAASRIILRLS